MKRFRLAVGVAVAVVVVVAVIWLLLGRNKGAATGELVLTGNVDIRQVQLAFFGSERIATVQVKEGDHVRKGQVLASLEKARLQANVADREALKAAQEEVVRRLEAGNRPEEIRKAEADLEASSADLRNAELTADRVFKLVAQGADTTQASDDARAALDVARARKAAAVEAHALMVLGPRKEDIAAARATLQACEAQLELARRDLADADVEAPADGVVEDRILEPGDMASPQKPVLTLALDDPLWVRVYVAETDLPRIRPGMKATVTADGFPGRRYEGWVGYISPTAEFTPKSVETLEVRTKLVYQVRVFVQNPRGELRLGMPAVVTVPLDQPAQP
jgi:HlyD family secretion protein